jgi:hypothetical protein
MRVAALLTLLIIAMLAASSSNVTVARSEMLVPMADRAG